MQSAKDTFYVALRDRIAALNPSRTVVVRGVSRPGVLVMENELATTFLAADAFWLQWAEMSVDAADTAALVKMRCEIHYATDGTTANGGMDRGRLLAGMDAELAKALACQAQHVTKTAYSSGGSAAMSTDIFWTDPTFGKLVSDGERLTRVATTDVFAYQEAGEL